MVIDLFDRFFINENIFINSNENNLLQEYIKYADSIRDSDLMVKLDKFLGSIQWTIQKTVS